MSRNYGEAAEDFRVRRAKYLQKNIVANNSGANCLGVTLEGLGPKQRWLVCLQRTG